MAEYRRGTGPDALPQGAASRINRATPPPGGADFGYQANEVPIQWARGEEPDEPEGKMSENMEVLTSPPDAGYKPPLMSKQARRVPARVVRNLDKLYAAQRHPDAPPLLRAAYRYWLWQLEQEGR